jgi:hypothetical protein
MNCALHPDVQNTAFCIRCGKPLCAQCVRQVQSSIYCEACLPENPPAPNIPNAPASPKGIAQPAPAVQIAGGTSPEGAFFLGLIPGVGAIYNAEYFKAAMHLLVFGTLITLSNTAGRNGELLFALLSFGFYAYMPFEAYYTAKKRKLAREGIELITPFDNLNEQLGQFGDMSMWGGILLVVAGTFFLLDNFGIVRMTNLARFWPVLLIVAGVAVLNRFLKGSRE